MIRGKIKNIFKSTQHSNSIYLTIAQGFVTVLGYLFWVFVSRLYPTEAVGVASSLISMSLLVAQVSILGLNQGIVRFLPTAKQKDTLVTSCLWPAVVTSVVLSAVTYALFVMPAIGKASSALYAMFFVMATLLATLNMYTDAVFLAKRATRYNMVIYGAYGLIRILLPALFVLWGSLGIFTANLAGTAIAVALSFYYMHRRLGYRFSFVFDKLAVRKLAVYAAINHIAGFFWVLPMLVIPSMALHVLGAQMAAHLYIIITVFNILLILPMSAAQSLYAEGSHEGSGALRSLVVKSLKFTYTLQGIGIVGLLVLGEYILGTFGASYAAGGLSLLLMLAPASLVTTANLTCNTILKVQNHVWHLLYINGVGAVVTLATFALCMPRYGLAGVGIGYIAGQLSMTILHGFSMAFYSRLRNSEPVRSIRVQAQ